MPVAFSDEFRADLDRLLRWRRDVRRFRSDPVPDTLLETLLDSVRAAPSVGLSQPWRILDLASPGARAQLRANFETANARALAGYEGERARLYAGLKLAGLDQAPVQWAVYCDETTETGAGLGAATMPEMRRYSVVCAVMQMWLTARAHGLGIGWLSILDPAALARALDVPDGWRLVACLCIGFPEHDSTEPELQRLGWEDRHPRPVPELR